MASFMPPPPTGSALPPAPAFDTEMLVDTSIAIVLILSIVFVRDIDLFVQRNVLLLSALVFSLIFAAGVLYSSSPPLALMAMLLLASIVAVQRFDPTSKRSRAV
jgi:hypothetical protein